MCVCVRERERERETVRERVEEEGRDRQGEVLRAQSVAREVAPGAVTDAVAEGIENLLQAGSAGG